MKKFEWIKEKITSITCIKVFPEFNEIKIYYGDDNEIISLDSSEEYESILKFLNENISNASASNLAKRNENVVWN